MMHTLRFSLILFLTTSAHAATPPPADQAPSGLDSAPTAATQGMPVLHLYSSRQRDLLQPVIKSFADHTGVEVKLLTGKGDALIERLVREGASSPADVLITTDVARLHRAAKKDLLQPIHAQGILAAVPAHLRDKLDRWVGLSIRSRIIAYNPQRIDGSQITSYLDLADERYKNRVCMRSSNNEYNQSLMASLIYHHGQATARLWATGVVSNLFQHPQGNDRGQLDLIAAGACDLSLVNSYYVGLWLLNPASRQQKFTPAVIFPEQGSDQPGAHINISGGGVVASSKQRELAEQFLQFLLSQEGQRVYSHANQEYPVDPQMPPPELIRSLGWPVKFDDSDIELLGKLNAQAVTTFDQARWR
ncbi:MAG: extracellular solute-binding protein [Gammaproteobacteria bacterium]|nr:extracellular solute-binding protein [Gammaproteobacteria bacterium]